MRFAPRAFLVLLAALALVPAVARAEIVRQAYALPSGGGYPHDVAIAARGCAWLKHHGYHMTNPDVLARRYLRFGGTDAERLADLHAIGTGVPHELTLAVRGGYGIARLLAQVDFARIAAQARASGTPSLKRQWWCSGRMEWPGPELRAG